ncbi:MAG: tRNA dihydrouridine(20/20a) synthase DusA [Pseudomonadota bacterium]|jgi:tRNA-dihydrouridine synthase A
MTATSNMPDHTFCIAPMMDWTDRHERYFLRLFSRHALLYTEMLTSAALVRGKADHLLAYHPDEHPVAVQLGGSDPDELSAAAVLADQAGYREINLNIGCPSDRVQSGRFGACLMAEPALVARCVSAISRRVTVPVTVKCRIGIDDMDSDEALEEFISQVAAAGCRTFIIHARIAILNGLSPRQNREIPPLNYSRVLRMKARFPELEIVINGGITTLAQVLDLLQEVDGVMVGREAYQNPFLLSEVDAILFGAAPNHTTRLEYLQRYLPYVTEELARGTPLQQMSKHVLGLFKGLPGGRNFRRHLSEHAHRRAAGVNVLLDAMAHVS